MDIGNIIKLYTLYCVGTTEEKLLNEKGVTAYEVSKATGIPNSTFSDWKTGKSKPKIEKLKKIAEYFQIPITELI